MPCHPSSQRTCMVGWLTVDENGGRISGRNGSAETDVLVLSTVCTAVDRVVRRRTEAPAFAYSL